MKTYQLQTVKTKSLHIALVQEMQILQIEQLHFHISTDSSDWNLKLIALQWQLPKYSFIKKVNKDFLNISFPCKSLSANKPIVETYIKKSLLTMD